MARVFPFIPEAKYKTIHVIWAWAELEILQKKTICMSFDRSSLIFDRSSLADLANKSCNSLDFNFTNKHTLSSLNLDLMSWSWFANTLQVYVLIHLDPKVLEPNKLPFWQSVTKHITNMKCSKLQTAQPNFYLSVANVDGSHDWINL